MCRLSYLGVVHPQFHLIVDKDGKTNQPEPKHPNTSKTSVADTLLDLKAQEVVVTNGVALLNNRAIPFDMAARDLGAEVHYIRSTDRYGMTVDLKDLRTKIAKQVEAQSALHVDGELGRDAAELQQFDIHQWSEFEAGGDGKYQALCQAGVADDGEGFAGVEADFGTGRCGWVERRIGRSGFEWA